MTDRRTPTPPPADWDRLADLYERALAATPEARSALLEALHRDDRDLAIELAAMLESTPTSAALELERALDTGRTASLEPGERVGAWRIVRFLASGGMGEVYLAERADGEVEQRAALKLLRPGLATADLLDRFRLERTLLARLEHPAIAPLLDAGSTRDGRPFLALRYVEGRTITTYCAEIDASAASRARLFVELCRAVQFAHSNLVVHRDLKPSNILVSDDGRVHLLDFGIAKLLGPREDATEPTRALELAPMTPQRAAPEQRRGEPVTTATDVWALGLLLHELFTGEMPRLGGDGAVAERGFRRRELDRDRAAIVARALATEPQRRYASAGELADDVERWLAGEPVKARPDSLVYRVVRFVARHRVATAAGAVAAIALAALSVLSFVRSREAERERVAAAHEAARSEAVVELVVELFGGLDPIAGAHPDNVSVGDLIELGIAKAARLEDQPDVRARLLHALGRIQLERSEWKSALDLLRRAREDGRSDGAEPTAHSLQLELDYSRALHSAGNHGGALAVALAVLDRLERAPAPDPELLAGARITAGAFEGGDSGEARILRGMDELQALPDSDPLDRAAALTALAWLRSFRGDKESAGTHFAEALAILRRERGATHPHTLGLESTLTSLLADPADRLREHRRVLALRLAKVGERHYTVANSWSAIGKAQLELGDSREAAESFERARSIWTETGGAEHPMARAAEKNRDRARAQATGQNGG